MSNGTGGSGLNGKVSYRQDADRVFVLSSDTVKKELVFQDRLGFAELAIGFGWEPCCGTGKSLGVNKCPDCQKNKSAMHHEAFLFLLDHEGEEISDPGFF